MKSNFKFSSLIMLVGLLVFVSCKKDEPTPAKDPIASFQFTVDAENPLKVNFINGSNNADSYVWDFGDGSETSTDVDPDHTFAVFGDYQVKLVATGANGKTSEITKTVGLSDPDEQLTLLAGAVSKDWKLVREGAAVGIGPDAAQWTLWFAAMNDGTRPCIYDDVVTFRRDGGFEYNDGGTFFGEGDVYANSDKQDLAESCFDATTDNLTVDGNDYSAWLSSTSHSYDYDNTNNKITLNGTGAWMGLIKLGTDGYVGSPQASQGFGAFLSDGGETGVDTLTIHFDYTTCCSNYWIAKYVSYDGTTPEPDLVSFLVDYSYEVDGRTVTFTNNSVDASTYSWDFGDNNTSTLESPTHTYAADGSYTVILTGTGTGGSKTAEKTIIIDTNNPQTGAPAPTEPEANVISIYSDAYTDISGVNLDPDWGQATVTTEADLDGGKVLKMAGLTYQGIDWTGNIQDVSGKTKLHVDVWCSAGTDVNVSLIATTGGGENAVKITTEAGVWKSFDILLSDYTVPNLSLVDQLKFDDAGSGTTPTIFVDNIYFY